MKQESNSGEMMSDPMLPKIAETIYQNTISFSALYISTYYGENNISGKIRHFSGKECINKGYNT